MEAVRASTLARPEFKANPYPFYARRRQDGPVLRMSAPFYGRAWLVLRYDDAVAMFKDGRISKDISARMAWLPAFTRPLTHQMLNRDPPDHTRLRALVSRAFTPQRIEGLRARVQAACEERLAAVEKDGGADLVAAYALPIPLTVIAELLGIPPADRPRFHRLTQGSLALGAPTGVFDLPRALPYVWLLTRYFRKLFAERGRRPGDDLMSALVTAEEAGDHLSEDELLGMAILLLFAGYETTVHLIGSSVLALLENPGQRDRFLHDPWLVDSAIEELLRYTSPVEMTPPRVTLEAVPLDGVTIPPGELVSAVVGSANRDETQFPDPDRLDLGRSPNRHLGFGHGAHFCLGATLARLEAQVALTTLFHRFPKMRLARPAESLRWRRLLPLRGLAELPVAF